MRSIRIGLLYWAIATKAKFNVIITTKNTTIQIHGRAFSQLRMGHGPRNMISSTLLRPVSESVTLRYSGKGSTYELRSR